uniref:Juvenile hormone-inducible n=1 Tax=Acartia pacifica TaxID=335913 RepID=A0A0U2VBQ9_ACAPC|nr:juvenile hormone-inducible [Acartia pacifica]
MSDCLQMNDSPMYQKLASLQDIKNLSDLTKNNVRDILRASLRNSDLEIVELGELKDMSGTNDAFNSSICSLQVKVRLGSSSSTKKPEAPSTESSSDATQATSETAAASGDNESSPEPAAKPTSTEDAKEENTAVAEEFRTFDLVVKVPPKASFMRLMHKLTKPFLNEVTWYLDMVKQIEFVEKDMHESSFKLANIVPVCYHAYSNYYAGEISDKCKCAPWFCALPFRSSEEGILLLENVTKRGYKMFNKMSILPLDHFLLAMSDLAHFHGRWLTYRWLGESGKLGEGSWSPDYLKQCLNTQKRPPRAVYQKLLKGTQKTVLKILELEGKTEYSDRIRKFFNVTANVQLDQFMGEVTTPIDTCCHGDFWSNNIMFKYNEEDKVESTMLIDFQLINYGHPAYDILYLLYLSSDAGFRDSNMESCLEHYWKTFSYYLEKYSPDEFKYGWTEFKADIHTYKSIVFVLATTLLPNVLSDIQVEAGGLLALRDLQRKQAAELADSSKSSTKEIKRRVIQLVEEMMRDNII